MLLARGRAWPPGKIASPRCGSGGSDGDALWFSGTDVGGRRQLATRVASLVGQYRCSVGHARRLWCEGRASMGAGDSRDCLMAKQKPMKPPTTESLRRRRYREKLRAAESLGLALRADAPPPQAGEVVPGQAVGSSVADSPLLLGLERLAGDESASGQARVSAARAVLEAQGVLGKHARNPGDEPAERPPGLLTRAGLERELIRLRRSVMPASREPK